jgi:hypothetical protein
VIETKIGDQAAQSNVDKLLKRNLLDMVRVYLQLARAARMILNNSSSLTRGYTYSISMSDGTSTSLQAMVC